MRQGLLLAACLVLLGPAAPQSVAGVRVAGVRSQDVDFSGLKTWAWRDAVEHRADRFFVRHPELAGWIEDSVAARLAGDGFEPAERDAADVLLDLRVEHVSRAVPAMREMDDPDPFYHERTGIPRGGDFRWETIAGTVVLEMTEREGRHVLWRGSMKSLLTERNRSQERIDRGVLKLFRKHPPRPPAKR